jgi:hypothetical protein
VARGKFAVKGDTNYEAFDRFTAAHFAVGVGFASMGLTLPQALMLSVAWETLEVPLKITNPKAFPAATLDSPANKAGDIMAVGIGCLLGRRVLGGGK